jgi:probable F420-dependent oxidoreductase
MKVGLFTIGIGGGARTDVIMEAARHAERLNFSTLWAAEHVVLFDRQESKYPYSESGEFAVSGDFDWLDPFLTLSYAAAITSRIRLATGICLVPEHHPLILAKQIATLDRLCGGRFALGVGIGWSAAEFEALGIPFERRAARTREYITLMRKLWSEQSTTFKGEFTDVKAVRAYPKPAAGAKLPILFGGESMPALRRVAEYGNGWYGFNLNPDEAAAKIAKLRSLIRENKRDPAEIEIVVSPYLKPCAPDDLKKYRAAGVDEVAWLFDAPRSIKEIGPKLEQIARSYVEPAAALK